jgi:hypothetical protein
MNNSIRLERKAYKFSGALQQSSSVFVDSELDVRNYLKKFFEEIVAKVSLIDIFCFCLTSHVSGDFDGTREGAEIWMKWSHCINIGTRNDVVELN